MPEQTWYFTFGWDHVDPLTNTVMRKKYVAIEGDVESTRQAMNDRFGNMWSHQYKYPDDQPEHTGRFDTKGAGVERFNLELFDHTLAFNEIMGE